MVMPVAMSIGNGVGQSGAWGAGDGRGTGGGWCGKHAGKHHDSPRTGLQRVSPCSTEGGTNSRYNDGDKEVERFASGGSKSREKRRACSSGITGVKVLSAWKSSKRDSWRDVVVRHDFWRHTDAGRRETRSRQAHASISPTHGTDATHTSFVCRTHLVLQVSQQRSGENDASGALADVHGPRQVVHLRNAKCGGTTRE